MSTTFPARSLVAAGMAAAVVGALAVTPPPAAGPAAFSLPTLVSPAVALSAAVQPLQQPL